MFRRTFLQLIGASMVAPVFSIDFTILFAFCPCQLGQPTSTGGLASPDHSFSHFPTGIGTWRE